MDHTPVNGGCQIPHYLEKIEVNSKRILTWKELLAAVIAVIVAIGGIAIACSRVATKPEVEAATGTDSHLQKQIDKIVKADAKRDIRATKFDVNMNWVMDTLEDVAHRQNVKTRTRPSITANASVEPSDDTTEASDQ